MKQHWILIALIVYFGVVMFWKLARALLEGQE